MNNCNPAKTWIIKLERVISIIVISASLLNWTGCAYFNTFYNARLYFKEAEEKRLEKVGENIPKAAFDAYGKVIEKSQRVLTKYPDSKFRNEAILLMGIAHFHRGEIRKAEITFINLEETAGADFTFEAQFWKALCKWKVGKVQPAIDELETLQQTVEDSDFKARILLARADIFLEEELNQQAFQALELAAELTRDTNERSQIFYQIASLAFRNGDYELAYRANKQVIKNSMSKLRINEANLNIVRIHREQGDHRNVESLIKSLLADEQYKDIHGALELELAKMYYEEGTLPETIVQLNDVVLNYKKTSESAEASFILGEIKLFGLHDLDSAKHYFELSVKEYGKSPVKQQAQNHIQKITKYLQEIESLEQNLDILYSLSETEVDTSILDTTEQTVSAVIDTTKLMDDIAFGLFIIGEMEAFHFNQPDSAEKYLLEIINFYSNNDYHPKALFTLSYLKYSQSDTSKAVELEDIILTEYPDSDYADYIRDLRGNPLELNMQAKLLRKGEVNWTSDRLLALNQYKRILRTDTTSETSARAAYFLAHHYDYTSSEPDSAIFYYRWLDQHHPNSEQNLAANNRLKRLTSSLEPAQPNGTIPTEIDSSGQDAN